ncbi:MAG: STAS domain-containing protein [Planctomycetes bacterium]|jgi:rsbT co-antagonist protein RsbR|nr:STAS domain-containing protein [Planctomycetota bacterium]
MSPTHGTPERESAPPANEAESLRRRLEREESLIQSYQYTLNTLLYLKFDGLQALLDTVVSLGCSIFGAPRGCLLLSEDGAVLNLRAAYNLPPGNEGPAPLLRGGLLGAAADERVPLVCPSWGERPDLAALTRPAFVEPPFVLVSVDVHDAPVGVLYFGPERAGAAWERPEPHHFKFLSGVAATAITNCQNLLRASSLTRMIQEQRDELEAKNRDLEQRTRELQEKVETVQVQQEEIQRLGTPVVAIWDGILCMPLVGMLDSQRAQQAMEVLLDMIIREKARIVIVDITGVPLVDSLVANHLAQTMAAVKLIGAEGILTGISAGVAQTLVKMGISIGEMSTRRTLADGLKTALGRLNFEIKTR